MVVERITRVHNPRQAPKKRKARRSAAKKRHHNPLPQVMTLGVINPAKGGHSMAKTRKRRRSAAHKTTHTKRNPSYKMKTRHHRRSHSRRNPFPTGGGAAGMAKSVVGGLVGVTLTKMTSSFIAGMVPSLTSSPVAKAAVSAVAAFLVGKAVSSVDPVFGAAAAFGGYMQAGSDALNLFIPNNPIGLKGLGVWMPSRYAVPENPVMRGMIAAAPAPASGMGFAGRRAF